MKRTLATLAVLALVAGCNTGKPTPSESPTTDTPPAMSPAPTSAAPASDAPKAASDLVIGFGSLGPATVGMSKDDALATGLFDANTPAPVDGCPAPPLTWKEPFNKDVDVVIDGDAKVVAFGVFGKGPKTSSGIGIGSTLADLKTAYGDDLTGPAEAGYGQSGAYVEDGDAWIGFLLNPAPADIKDTSSISFIEVSKGNKPDLMRDGC